VEKNHDVTAAGTEDFCLVRKTQHHVAGPQELAHPGRGNGKCRGEQPSRLSRPASCRVPEPWKFIGSVLVSCILEIGSCQGTGTGWDTRRDRRDACSPRMPPHQREPSGQSIGSTRAPRVVFRAARKACLLSAKRLFDPCETEIGARARSSGMNRPSRLTEEGP
jgi:hypothetical protein